MQDNLFHDWYLIVNKEKYCTNKKCVYKYSYLLAPFKLLNSNYSVVKRSENEDLWRGWGGGGYRYFKRN